MKLFKKIYCKLFGHEYSLWHQYCIICGKKDLTNEEKQEIEKAIYKLKKIRSKHETT